MTAAPSSTWFSGLISPTRSTDDEVVPVTRESRPARPSAASLLHLRGWWRTISHPPTSVRGVEGLLVVAVVCIRLGIVVEMAPSLPEGLINAPRPVLYGALWVSAVCVSVGVAWGAIRRRWGAGRNAGMVADVAATVLFLGLGSLVVASEFRINSWVGWQPGYALTVLLTISGMRDRRLWVGCVVSVVLAYLLYALPGLDEPGMTGTIIGTLLTFVVMGSIARFTVGYLRRAAADADAARAQAAESAASAEAAKARLAMHNATTVMQLLADPELPGELRRELQRQAVDEVGRMRAYLRSDPVAALDPVIDPADDTAGDPSGEPAARVPLTPAVSRALDGFGDLGLEPSLWAADGVLLPAPAAEAVTSALVALLHNVRVHAESSMVIVHAEATGSDEAPAWTVTVRDDGCGYDPDTVSYGIGIREQVIDQLAEHGVTVEITTAVGAGTRTVLTGPSAPDTVVDGAGG